MEAKNKFAQILKIDGKVRLLLGGMLLDGALILALIVVARLALAL
jgi:hypothetical protein